MLLDGGLERTDERGIERGPGLLAEGGEGALAPALAVMNLEHARHVEDAGGEHISSPRRPDGAPTPA